MDTYIINFIKSLLTTFNKNTFDTTEFIKKWLDVKFILDYNQDIETNSLLLKGVLLIRYNNFTEYEIKKIILNAQAELIIYNLNYKYKDKCIYEIAKIIKSFSNIEKVIKIVGIPAVPTLPKLNKTNSLKSQCIILVEALSYYKQLNYIDLLNEIYKIEKLIIDSAGAAPINNIYKYNYITIPPITNNSIIKELNNE